MGNRIQGHSAADGTDKSYLLCASALFRNDFNPVVVGVVNEIQAHGGVLIADAAHLLVLFVGCLVVVHHKGQMEFIIPQVIGFFPVPKPG